MTKISNQYSLTNILTADLANSRLGINNVSPAYSLDLTGTARVTTSAYFATASGSVGIGNTNGTVGALNVTGRIALTSSLFFSSNLTSEDRWEINVATPANDLYFSRSGVGERMRITSAGNVGIGTSTPSARLHTEVAVESPATSAVALLAKTSNGANDIFRWFDGATQLGVFKNNGNVGIGTSSPGYSLHVNGTAYAVGHIGGYVTASSGYVNETQTITTNGTSYYLRKYTGNANGSSTTIFNITGLNTANGTFADIYAVAQKDATGSAINTNLEVQINGQYMYGIQANGTAANTRICAFKVCRMDSSWVIIGTVRT